MSLLFLSRIENRHVLWTALLMVAIGFIVPGGFGVKPPQWFHERSLQDVASVSLAEPDKSNTAMAVAKPGLTTQAGNDLAANPTTRQAPLPAQAGSSQAGSGRAGSSQAGSGRAGSSQASSSQANLVTVPLKFARHIPAQHFELTGDTQKQSFIKLVLPLILAVNDELLRRRKAVQAALEANDRNMLDQWAMLYRIDPENLGDIELAERLLRRADTIPVALALAQAAVESGWGTSRFAQQGNALFGQWAWTESAGMRPLAASNERAVVRSFGSLLESVRAYMHNLNTHQNYKRFRDARYRLRSQAEKAKASRLAAYLDSYAEIGQAYVKKLLAVMSSNNFDQYAEAKLG